MAEALIKVQTEIPSSQTFEKEGILDEA